MIYLIACRKISEKIFREAEKLEERAERAKKEAVHQFAQLLPFISCACAFQLWVLRA